MKNLILGSIAGAAEPMAYTEVCYKTATSTSCYRPLDVYKSYGIDGLFILVPLFAFAYFLKSRRKNRIQL